MRLLSTVSTVLSVGFLAACSPTTSGDLVVHSGASGTYIAVGAELGGKVTSGASEFSFTHSRGLTVGVATGGPSPVQESESKLFMPASITKLVTTSLALKMLGPDFRFSTGTARRFRFRAQKALTLSLGLLGWMTPSNFRLIRALFLELER